MSAFERRPEAANLGARTPVDWYHQLRHRRRHLPHRRRHLRTDDDTSRTDDDGTEPPGRADSAGRSAARHAQRAWPLYRAGAHDTELPHRPRLQHAGADCRRPSRRGCQQRGSCAGETWRTNHARLHGGECDAGGTRRTSPGRAFSRGHQRRPRSQHAHRAFHDQRRSAQRTRYRVLPEPSARARARGATRTLRPPGRPPESDVTRNSDDPRAIIDPILERRDAQSDTRTRTRTRTRPCHAAREDTAWRGCEPSFVASAGLDFTRERTRAPLHTHRRRQHPLTLDDVDLGDPGPDDVIVRVDATPVNPTDIALMLSRRGSFTRHR